MKVVKDFKRTLLVQMKTRKLENFKSKRGQQLPQSLYLGEIEVDGWVLEVFGFGVQCPDLWGLRFSLRGLGFRAWEAYLGKVSEGGRIFEVEVECPPVGHHPRHHWVLRGGRGTFV